MADMTDLVDNILSVYRAATDEQIQAGINWYPLAHDFSRSLDTRFHRAAGVIAALSPKNGWTNNKNKAMQLYRQNGDGTGCGMSQNVAKAIRIYNGEDALDVLGSRRGKKTLNFFSTIVNPLHPVAVVDAHAHDLAVGRQCSDKERSILGRKGQYERFSEAYCDAASIEGVPVSVIQATTWISWRDSIGKSWHG